MILDTLDNIGTYKNLSNDIYSGLQFLKRLEPGISLGSFPINDRVKVIVEEYQTESGEALRDDVNFSYVSAWEFKENHDHILRKENLYFDNVVLTQRSYK